MADLNYVNIRRDHMQWMSYIQKISPAWNIQDNSGLGGEERMEEARENLRKPAGSTKEVDKCNIFGFF